MSLDEKKRELSQQNKIAKVAMPDKVVKEIFKELQISEDNLDAVIAKNQLMGESEVHTMLTSYQKGLADVQRIDKETNKAFKNGQESALDAKIGARRIFFDAHDKLKNFIKEHLRAKLDFAADGKDGMLEFKLYTDKFKNNYVYDVPLPASLNNENSRRLLKKVIGLETESGEGKPLLQEAKRQIREVVFTPGQYLDDVGQILLPLHKQMESLAMEYTKMLEKDPTALDARLATLEKQYRNRGQETDRQKQERTQDVGFKNKLDDAMSKFAFRFDSNVGGGTTSSSSTSQPSSSKGANTGKPNTDFFEL